MKNIILSLISLYFISCGENSNKNVPKPRRRHERKTSSELSRKSECCIDRYRISAFENANRILILTATPITNEISDLSYLYNL